MLYCESKLPRDFGNQNCLYFYAHKVISIAAISSEYPTTINYVFLLYLQMHM